jgi:hypothetical protein
MTLSADSMAQPLLPFFVPHLIRNAFELYRSQKIGKILTKIFFVTS